MAIRVALHHKTSYLYDRPVSLEPHLIRLRPAPHCRTPVLSYSLKITPENHFINWQQDPYGNYQARLVFPEPARKLEVEVDLVADMAVINPFDFFIDRRAEEFPFAYDAIESKELAPYCELREQGPKLKQLVESWRRTGTTKTVDYLVELNRDLSERIRYLIRMEPGIQSCEETLEKGSGSCRDTSWLLVQALRHLGFAARFTSGYLIQLTPDEKSVDGPSGPSEDFTDLHAWTEVYLPGAGWVGLDATSGLLAGEGHLPLACAADPLTASPISGSFGFAPTSEDDKVKEKFEFTMSVQRIRQPARVTLPYEETQWQRVMELGHQLDERLQRQDVRLTMGGEPTFVAVDARDDAQWNTAALGREKRELAGRLLRRLRDKFAPKGLLHFGQGKQYPGESLPRWALTCIWRRDGEPFWQDPRWEADEAIDYGFGFEEAERFTSKLLELLDLPKDNVQVGFEDPYYYLWKEGQLPSNVDPLDNRLDDAEERARIRKVFEQGLGHRVGLSIPMQYQQGFYSGPWSLRRGHLFLIPGDSSMGFRLPLDSLPWTAPEQRPDLEQRDYFEELPPLQRPQRVIRRKASPEMGYVPTMRTALCVEPRDGKLYLFLPPLPSTEAFVELVQAIEQTAAGLEMPVLLEGYRPEGDPRLNSFAITPDPGVLEVNIHPSSSWEELADKTEIIYEEARQVGLAAEKFALDGRHVGTGGGNHILLGGPTPADSPILRRPDLLQSLLTFWNHHPSLSYLFAGQFIGPTSQAPRLDEARSDSLYELEIAFQQLPRKGNSVPLWVVDRVLRNLLVDMTGNTHRAEFCIDKLYSPDGPSGRRGLVEMRSFEMPPHYRMSLAQQLLLRALVSVFWEEPYRHPLVEWGTELHDRFMLRHFIERDFSDVLQVLQDAGLAFERDWFEPHLEFRFPKLGEFGVDEVKIEVRHALEPWHVLGEEPGLGGAVRYVDSSLERIEVKIMGMVDGRHQLACNGVEVPLHPTGRNGEFVAGIRFRAWQPPSCLHPTIGVHTPLVIELVDRWNQRSLAACTYHVSHPGGRSYDRFPVNAYEAEARRISRFYQGGQTPGVCRPRVLERSRKFPLTLDLRRS